MQSLVDFLLARIAEDERDASAALRDVISADGTIGARWWGAGSDVMAGRDDHVAAVSTGDLAVADHIARWDPARVLAECDAKRRIIGVHGLNEFNVDPCDAHDDTFASVPCDTVRLLALPYADHPDYRDEWRP